LIVLADAANSTTAPQSPGSQPVAPGWTGLVPLLLMMVMVVVLFIGPQRKKAKQQAAMLQALKTGDKIVTTSGIVGTVVSVKEKTAAIRSSETKLEILKSSIVEITERVAESNGGQS